MEPRKHTPRHIIITSPKIKNMERILKAAREKETVTYKGVPRRLSADFSKESLQARRSWKEVFQSQERPASKITLSSKASFRMGGRIKCFPDKVKFKEFIINKPL